MIANTTDASQEMIYHSPSHIDLYLDYQPCQGGHTWIWAGALTDEHFPLDMLCECGLYTYKQGMVEHGQQ